MMSKDLLLTLWLVTMIAEGTNSKEDSPTPEEESDGDLQEDPKPTACRSNFELKINTDKIFEFFKGLSKSEEENRRKKACCEYFKHTTCIKNNTGPEMFKKIQKECDDIIVTKDCINLFGSSSLTGVCLWMCCLCLFLLHVVQ